MGYQKVWVMLPDDLAARICDLAAHDEVAPNSLIRQAAADYVCSREEGEGGVRRTPEVEKVLMGIDCMGDHWAPKSPACGPCSTAVPDLGDPDEG